MRGGDLGAALIPGAWQDDAVCKGKLGRFFSSSPQGEDDAVVAGGAKAICRTCPVVEEWLDYALRTGEKHGVWGGLTPGERRALPRR